MFSSFSDLAAWRRTRSLAGQRGVDLARGVVDGWLHRDEVDTLVAACATCGKAVPCSATFSQVSHSGCPNLPSLDALRP